jgi:hypothetical protein
MPSLFEQRIAAGGWRNWWGWRLRGLLDRDRRRRSDLCNWRRIGLDGLLGFESGATARALFPVSLAFLLGAFAGGL